MATNSLGITKSSSIPHPRSCVEGGSTNTGWHIDVHHVKKLLANWDMGSHDKLLFRLEKSSKKKVLVFRGVPSPIIA